MLSRHNEHTQKVATGDLRLRIASIVVIAFIGVIIFRLVTLMFFQHGFYEALAAGSQGITAELFPDRGRIYVQDSRSGDEYPVALNKEVFTVYADTRHVEDVDEVLGALTGVFEYDDARREHVRTILQKENDPYEPLERAVERSVMEELAAFDLPGIGFVPGSARFYPEGRFASQVIGFVGKDEEGGDIGQYGLEGYWHKELSGRGGFLEAAKGVTGSWISLADRSVTEPEDGMDLLLTIDRTLQFKACEELRRSMESYEAEGASLIILDPKTGAIRTMCGYPDFDPNTYSEVENIRAYNNDTIFTPYEPGSVFKPVTMASALNAGVVHPRTPFHDFGVSNSHCDTPITNADNKIYGDTDMTGVLEDSINTGMVYVVDLLGKTNFRDHIEAFGFGIKQGLEIDTEVTGKLDALYRNKGGQVDCYTATASYGQGITATPLQIAAAFGAIARDGQVMKPHIIEEKRLSSGKVELVEPLIVGEPISPKAADLTRAMLVNVIDNGQAEKAAVPGYYVGGKTGTAQIAGPNGYTTDTNHTFAGFAPADDPAFVIVVKFHKPKRRFASMTAAPAFGRIAQIALEYYQIAPSR